MRRRTPKTIFRIRTMSATPLARAHEHQLRKLDWARFDRRRYRAEARDLAARALIDLAAGEYEAFVGFSQVSSALALVAAPFDLLSAAARIPADEIRHADYALRLAAVIADCEPSEIPIRIEQEKLRALSARKWDFAGVDSMMVAVPAIMETISAGLLAARRDQARDPLVRTVLSSILADEIHHARLGWYYLMWRAPQWSREERQQVADRAGSLVAGMEVAFWRGREAPRGCRQAARALGVLDSRAQRAAVCSVMEQEIVPGLDALGLGASHAWRSRQRGK